MNKLTIGWMYPNLLNLHGERGSVQMLAKVGQDMGLDVQIRRFEDFQEPIPFEELDMLIFLPGEIETFRYLIPALQNQKEKLDAYLEKGGYLLAIGTTGLLFGNQVTREDGSLVECLGYLDMVAKERKYVWGDDLHVRIRGSKQELAGSQIQMADVDCKQPFADVIYGYGNAGKGTEGGRWKNLIYTNCLGPLFVKNPWFAEAILKDICLQKFMGLRQLRHTIASDSFDATLDFIATKPKK